LMRLPNVRVRCRGGDVADAVCDLILICLPAKAEVLIPATIWRELS
jgi:hypothetical protein